MTISLKTYRNVPVYELIFEAYENCGKNHEELDPNHTYSAIRSINIMSTSWAVKYDNLYSIQPFIIPLVQGQATYRLPYGTADIPTQEVSLAQLNRQLGGTPSSTAGGNAANPFTPGNTSSCTQTSPNGSIIYDYGSNPQAINYIGIQSNVTASYNILIEYAYDQYAATNDDWQVAVICGVQTFGEGNALWFANKVAIQARYWRIRETGGGTLDIQQIYFDTNYMSRILAPMSRSEYIAVPNKSIVTSTSSYEITRSTDPYITLWPAPILDYPYLVMNLKVVSPIITGPSDILDIPALYYDAFVSELAYRVGKKLPDMDPNKLARLENDMNRALTETLDNDIEHVNIRFLLGR